MKYGFCTGFATSPLFAFDGGLVKGVKAAGYDFAELPLICLEDFDEDSMVSLSSWFEAPVMCNLFPARISLYSDTRQAEEYLSRMLPRASALGVKRIVFGSGKSRSYPHGMPLDAAYESLAALISNKIAPIAEDNGIEILIEPLSYGECNIINTVEEGYKLVNYVSHRAFSLMADIFHMANNGEKTESLARVFPAIKHVHIAEKSRKLPENKFSEYVSSALSILKSCGYNRTISYETSDGDKGKALELIKSSFNGEFAQ